MGIRSFLRGDNIEIPPIEPSETRTLTRDNTPVSWLPYSRTALLDVTRSNALRVADAYACIRVLSDAVASLPPKIYRKTPQGRVTVGDDQRLAALLRTPSPGSTSADLFGLIMVYLNVYGTCYVGKFGGPDGEVAQLACIHPDRVVPEVRGSTLVYRIDGDDSYGVRDLAKHSRRGWRLEKAHDSANIDALIALRMALDRAAEPVREPKVIGWI